MMAVSWEIRRAAIKDVVLINANSIKRSSTPSNIEYIDISSVGSGEFTESPKFMSFAEAPSRARRMVKAGDTILSTVRPNRRSFLFLSSPSSIAVASTGFAVLTPTPAVNARFLYYWVTRQDFTDYLSLHAKGAAYPAVSAEDIGRAEIVLPPLSVQESIAGILSAYDELIENSQRRINILESMARALYREWFVHFRFPGHENHSRVVSPLGEIPQGWEVKKLGDMSDNFDRMRKPLSKMQRSQLQGEYPYYGAAKVFDYVNDYIFDGEYLLLAEDGSVITQERAPVLQLVNEKFWPNNHTHVLRGKPPFSTHFLYLGLSEADISPYITGAAQPKITQENMNRIPFFCGPEDLHLEFNRLVEPMIRQSQILNRQVQNFRRTRDQLLPRLLSGQIDVTNLLDPMPT
jgi:type I restriction enzyme S subunit